MKAKATMSWKMLTAVILAVLMVASTAAAFSPDNGNARGDFGRRGHQRSMLGIWQHSEAVSQLGLTEEQVSRLKEADFASREKRLELSARMDRLRLDMQRARAANPIDPEAIRGLAKKIAADIGAMYLQRTEAQLAAAEILTPEQIEKLKQYQHRRGPQRQGSRGWNAPHRHGDMR